MNKNFVLASVFLVFISLAFVAISWQTQNNFALPNIPTNTPFFISTAADTRGQILAQVDTQKINISPTGYTVDQFILWKKNKQQKIFFLAQKNATDSEQKILFERDLISGKTRKILDESEFLLQKIAIHPQQKWLIIEKNNRQDYNRVITMLDIQKKSQQPIPVPKSWVNFSFSPNGQSIVGLDTEKDVGFEIQNFWSATDKEIILGNFLQNFGFSPDGKKILFSQAQNNDIFSTQTNLILQQTNGEKINIFSANKIVDAKWINQNHVLVASHNQNFEYQLHKIFLTDTATATQIHQFQNQKIMALQSNKSESFFISTQTDSNEIFPEPRFEIYAGTLNSPLKKRADAAFGWQIFK